MLTAVKSLLFCLVAFGVLSAQAASKSAQIYTYTDMMKMSPSDRLAYMKSLREIVSEMEMNFYKEMPDYKSAEYQNLLEQKNRLEAMLSVLPEAYADLDGNAGEAKFNSSASGIIPRIRPQDSGFGFDCISSRTNEANGDFEFSSAVGTCVAKGSKQILSGGRDKEARTCGAGLRAAYIAGSGSYCVPEASFARMSRDRQIAVSSIERPAKSLEEEIKNVQAAKGSRERRINQVKDGKMVAVPNLPNFTEEEKQKLAKNEEVVKDGETYKMGITEGVVPMFEAKKKLQSLIAPNENGDKTAPALSEAEADKLANAAVGSTSGGSGSTNVCSPGANTCKKLSNKERAEAREKYGKSAGASGAKCFFAGMISGYNSATPVAGGCKPVAKMGTNGGAFKCPTKEGNSSWNQTVCNPFLYCRKNGSAVEAFCVRAAGNAVAACADDAKKSGDLDCLNEVKNFTGLQEEWNKFRTDFASQCSDANFQGLFCNDCHRLATRIAELNKKFAGKYALNSCGEPSTVAPTSGSGGLPRTNNGMVPGSVK